MDDNTRKRLFSKDAYISMALGLLVVFGLGLLVYNYVIANREAKTTQVAQLSQTEQLQNSNLPRTYTVAAGDTLWSISEKMLTSGYNWVDIAKANDLIDSNDIKVGQKLTIPEVKPIQLGEVSSGVTNNAPPKTHTIVPGDTLWSIGEKYYQSGYKWVDIAKANNLTNPDLIHAGNVLSLP